MPVNEEDVVFLRIKQEIILHNQLNKKDKQEKIRYKMDKTDKIILNALQKDAKQNMKVLADELNLSKSPLYDRVKRLESDGYISHYAAIVNKDKIGKPLVVFCRLALLVHEHENYARFVNEIVQLEEVVECYSIGGEYELLIKIVLEDLDAYDKFRFEKLTRINGIAKINSSITIRELKNTTYIKL